MQLPKYVLIAIAATISQHAFAAASLLASEPANHAMLERAPDGLSLSFSEPVRLTAVTVQQHGATDKQSLGPLPSGTLDRFVVAAPDLAAGGYTVTWRALSEDATVTTGEFMFMVGAMGQHTMPMNHAEHMQHMERAQPMPHGAGMDHSQSMPNMPLPGNEGTASPQTVPGTHEHETP